ncbi:hypothetical protein [Streptomyces sudanensis]|uniref:hypothetical protein n=1 Tax=Streptomyces sudanensis TaxID=436397 RepID=UPI0020CDAEF4|nr:hypothetical protein [Streptomyces sudanensis]MCP9959666.1 hypothetical protein [Streptomyces sudanensis]MCP9988722.1 hypothetical protein [Streptomyces sudanensis]MCP9999907.1 hypothetical protein [Streptomyces sudanensis]
MLAETICYAVSAAGLGIAAITAYRRRFLAAARVAAYALVPLGLVLTGAVEWVAGMALSPVAWAGFGLLGASWLLFAVTRTVERRRGARRERGVAGAERPAAVAPARPPAAPAAGERRTGGNASADDFDEIEAILRKHGI